MESIIREICEQEVHPDGMLFDVESITGANILDRAEYQGVRVRFTGYLGTARVPMQIDIGFSDILVPAAISVEYPTILDMPAPKLSAYSWESLIAEKFQAMVFLGSINSRMKDFYDVWLLTHEATIEGSQLQKAIRTTFENRSTPLPTSIPIQFSQPFAKEKQRQWDAFTSRENITYAGVDSFAQVVKRLNDFLLPVLVATRRDTEFDRVWNPVKGWIQV